MSFMDLNGDGRMDLGEQFIGYRVFQETTCNKGNPPAHVSRIRKPDGFELFILILLAYEIFHFIAGLIY